MHVQTVPGRIGLEQLGHTLVREHLFSAVPGAEFDPSASFDHVANPRRCFAGDSLPLSNKGQIDAG